MNTLALRVLNSVRQGFIDFVSKPASPKPLAALRIGLAAVLLCQAFAFAGSLLDLYGAMGIVQWRVLPFGPPPEVPNIEAVRVVLAPVGVNADSAVQIVFYAYVASLVCLLVGWQTRIAAVVAWLTQMALKTTGITSIYGVDEFAHIALFYCVWMPVGYAWSLDLQSSRKKGSGPICAKHPEGRSGKWGLTPFSGGRVSDEPTPLARLALRVLQLHLCIAYFFSGFEKGQLNLRVWELFTGADQDIVQQWVNGEAIWRSVMRPDLAMFDLTFIANYPTLAIIGCLATLIVEVGYPLMIWSRWTRLPWALATIGLHVGIGIFLGLWSFAAVMIVLNVAALVIPAEPKVLPTANPVVKRGKKFGAVLAVA